MNAALFVKLSDGSKLIRVSHIPYSHCITNVLFPLGLGVDILGYDGVGLLVTTDDNEEAVLFVLCVGVGCSCQVVLDLA